VVSDLHPLDSVVWSAAAQPRFRTGLLATIAGLAVVIGAIGLYGVIAYSVSQRTREIGIRMALGARSGDVLVMILREGLGLVAAGMTAGLVAAMAATRLLRGLLFGIASTDVTSFALACAVLLAVAAVATYLPARRATAVDPLVALRQE
jgi:putative ABC transport system permease protein